MTVTNQTALDPLINALGQMNLHGPPSSPTAPAADKPAEKTDHNDNDLDDPDEEIAYKSYRPAKLLYGKDHPDDVVENATLASIEPPDITVSTAYPVMLSCCCSPLTFIPSSVQPGPPSRYYRRGEAVQPTA